MNFFIRPIISNIASKFGNNSRPTLSMFEILDKCLFGTHLDMYRVCGKYYGPTGTTSPLAPK